MAIYSVSTKNRFTLRLTLNETSYSTSTGRSTISYKLELIGTGSGGQWFYDFAIGSSVSVGGTRIGYIPRSDNVKYDLAYGATITIIEGSGTVSRNNAGSLNVAYSIDMADKTYTPGPLSGSGTFNATPFYTISASVSPASSGSISGTGKYAKGNRCTLRATAGTNYSFVNWTKGGSQVSTSASYSFTVNASASYVANFKLKQATLTSAPNFTDDNNPRITYTNPGSGATIYAYIEVPSSSRPIAERQISGTSYTFNFTEEERTALRRINTKSNTQTMRFVVRTRIGSQDYWSWLDRTLTINNPNPIFNPSPVVEDINATTLALTGSKNRIVKYYSNAKITFNAKAVKEATLASRKVTCGTKSLTSDGTINNVENNVFNFEIEDSRGNTATTSITKTLVNYVKLTCNLGNAVPDVSGNYELNLTGNYFSQSFGSVSNSLTLQYRYKLSSSSVWSSWISITIGTLTGSTYNITRTITIDDFDYSQAYDIQARALDKLMTVESVSKTIKATPVFDWSETDFNINAELRLGGKSIFDVLYPVGSVYMSVSSTNPGNIFGGTWTQISGRFLYCSTNSKQTGGSNTINLAHTHTTAGHTLTINEIPSHGHPTNLNVGNRSQSGSGIWAAAPGEVDSTWKPYAGNVGGGKSHNHGKTGSALSNTTNNNMPAYFTVYCWYRTA